MSCRWSSHSPGLLPQAFVPAALASALAEAIPSHEALRDYFPAIDATQTPSYAIATYYRLIPAGQGGMGDAPLRLRLVYHGMIDDPPTPPAARRPGPCWPE
jgi:hypothetical protein